MVGPHDKNIEPKISTKLPRLVEAKFSAGGPSITAQNQSTMCRQFEPTRAFQNC